MLLTTKIRAWRAFAHLVESNDVRMAEHFHDLNLAQNLVEVTLRQLRFVDDFNRNLKSSILT